MIESINNKNIDSENALYLSFSDVDGYIIVESGSKYLILALAKKNKKALRIYKTIWNEIKKQMKAVNGAESIKYKKDFMKIMLDLYDDDLPIGKSTKHYYFEYSC